MFTKFVTAAFVSSDAYQLQDGLNKNDLGKVREDEKNGRQRKDPTLSKRSYTRRLKLSPGEKLQSRRERNRITAQASRIKARQKEGVLKQRLFRLEYETMKLLLENETLKEQSLELEVENQNLKLKTQSLYHGRMVEENNVEATFRHAWFVSIPQQKEWGLLIIFFTLIISIWEAVREKVMILNYWVLYVKQNRNVIKILNLVCHPWMLMMHLAVYLNIPTILNG